MAIKNERDWVNHKPLWEWVILGGWEGEQDEARLKRNLREGVKRIK